MKKKLVPVVKQEPEKEVPVVVLAEAIKAISEGMKKLRRGPLKDDALFMLIQRAAPKKHGRFQSQLIPMSHVKAVIQGIENLEKEYLK